MLNKSLKLIRTVKGFDAKAVSLEIGRVPTHVSKIERENLHILPNTLESLSSVYQMPISEMERISSLDDKGYNTPSIINEISKYYILKERKEIFEANHITPEHIANELSEMAFGEDTPQNIKLKALDLLQKQTGLQTQKVQADLNNNIQINITGD